MGAVDVVEVLDARGRVLARHRIDAWPLTIGRALENGVIVDDPFVCPQHVRIERDGDGEIVVTDLASRNGTYREPGGQRIDRAPLAPGVRIRIGATVLRFASRHETVPPALPYRRDGDAAPWVTRRPIAALAWLAIPLVLIAYRMLVGYDHQRASDVIGTDLLFTVLVAFWAAAWAFANRIVAHQWRFAAHAAIACAFFLVNTVPQICRDYVRFLLDDAWSGYLLRAACVSAPIAWLLGGHLAVVGTMPRRTRRVVAGAAALLVVALATLVASWNRLSFSSDVHYDATLRVMPRAWIPRAPVSTLDADVDALDAEVRVLASER